MRGRISGYTTGIVNYIPMEGRNVEIDIGHFQEMIIISTKSGAQFSTAGDCGSFIYNHKGRVVAIQVTESFPAA